MSTILDALRRLQAERESGPGIDPRDALGGRGLAVTSRRVALRGIGLGAVLGAASVALLTTLWLLSGTVFPSLGWGDSAQPGPGGPDSPQASAALPPPDLEEPAAPGGPSDNPVAPDPVASEPVASEPPPEPPSEPVNAATAARLQRVRMAQNERTRDSEQGARNEGAANHPAETAAENGPASFRAVARRPAPAAATDTVTTPPGATPRRPAPRTPPATRAPSAAGGAAAPRSATGERAAAPRPARGRGRRTRPAPAPAESALTPGRSTPPPSDYVDPVAFPALAVSSVRWHPDPARRQATVEVDTVVVLSAREGEKVGGALLSRIDPGQVEFRIGTRTKVVRVGK